MNKIETITKGAKAYLKERESSASPYYDAYLDRLIPFSQNLRELNDARHFSDTRYSKSTEFEKNFIAINETFEKAHKRLQDPNNFELSIFPVRLKRNVYESELEHLSQPLHPLMKLAVEAWKNRPSDPKTDTKEHFSLDLQKMLQIGLIYTQRHIRSKGNKEDAQGIIIATQKLLIDTALGQMREADIGKDSAKSANAKEMFSLALNLTAEPHELFIVENGYIIDPDDAYRSFPKDDKYKATFSERVLYEPIAEVRNPEFDATLGEHHMNQRIKKERIDFVGAYLTAAHETYSQESKALRILHEQAIKYPQQVIYEACARAAFADRALEWCKKRPNELSCTVETFVRNHPLNAKTNTVVENTIRYYIDELDTKFSRNWQRTTMINDSELIQILEARIQLEKANKGSLSDVMTSQVSRKNRKGELVHAGHTSEELFDHINSMQVIFSLDLPASMIKAQFDARKKALKDLFRDSYLYTHMMKLLLEFNPEGARLHISPYRGSVMGALVDGAKGVVMSETASKTQAKYGSIAAQSDPEINIVPDMHLLPYLYTYKKGDKEISNIGQLSKAIYAHEFRNVRKALKDQKINFNFPTISMIRADQADSKELQEITKIFGEYLTAQLSLGEEKFWSKKDSEITPEMWEFQRFMLNLLAEQKPFELNGVQYVPNKQFKDMVAKTVIEFTLKNLSMALELDSKSEKNWEKFIELFRITVPFMPLETRQFVVERYATQANMFAGDYVRNGRWKAFCFAVGFWDIALLPGKLVDTKEKPKTAQELNLDDPKLDGTILVRDLDLMPTINKHNISIVSGYKHIDGITSQTLVEELEKILLDFKQSNRRELARTLAATATDITRNFYQTDAERDTNYADLFKAVHDAVILVVSRRFDSTLPVNPGIVKDIIEHELGKAQEIRDLIGKGKKLNPETILHSTSKWLEELNTHLVDKLPSKNPLINVREVLAALPSAAPFTASGSAQINSGMISEIATLTGDAVVDRIKRNIATQVLNGVTEEETLMTLRGALKQWVEMHEADLAIHVHKYLQYLVLAKRLNSKQEEILKLERIYAEQEAQMTQYVVGAVSGKSTPQNQAIATIRHINENLVALGYPPIEINAELLLKLAKRDHAIKSSSPPKIAGVKGAQELVSAAD